MGDCQLQEGSSVIDPTEECQRRELSTTVTGPSRKEYPLSLLQLIDHL